MPCGLPGALSLGCTSDAAYRTLLIADERPPNTAGGPALRMADGRMQQGTRRRELQFARRSLPITRENLDEREPG